MKRIFFLLVISSVFITLNSCGQDFKVKVYYLSGEKSKDSHSTTENISVDGSSVSYSIKYKGRKGNNQQDNRKECTFTEQNIENIKKTILLKDLNRSDSLYQESSKTKSLEYYSNISIDITMNGDYFRIRLNGDTNELEGTSLYDNSIFFIQFLRKMIQDCT